ncbi:MAG: hypothetical protein RL312_665, partial [Pseudomonadota bacterium]
MQQGKTGCGDHQVNLVWCAPANILLATLRMLIIKFRRAEACNQPLAQHIALGRSATARNTRQSPAFG